MSEAAFLCNRNLGNADSVLLITLHNLVQSEGVDVYVDLNPNRHVVGHLETKLLSRVALSGEEFLNVIVIDEEVEHAALIAKVFRDRRKVQNLIVARVLAQV
jgi:hypothetical protein